MTKETRDSNGHLIRPGSYVVATRDGKIYEGVVTYMIDDAVTVYVPNGVGPISFYPQAVTVQDPPTHKDVDPTLLPTLDQVGPVADRILAIWKPYQGRPVRYLHRAVGVQETDLHYDVWTNSTKTTGVRTIRLRIWCAMQEQVDRMIARTAPELLSLPVGSWKVYSWSALPFSKKVIGSYELLGLQTTKLTNNVVKIYYRSRDYTKSEA